MGDAISNRFDPSVAYIYGTCVEAAYRLFTPGVVTPLLNTAQVPAGWQVLTELNAVDRVAMKTEEEFFGLVLQSDDEQQVLLTIRGTDTFLEWLVDAEFVPCAFPGVPSAGRVESGFCGVYSSLRVTSASATPLSLIGQLPPATKVTIAGHSLGAAVATLLALDVCVNLPDVNLTLYTYASPRVGDAAFARLCDARLATHYRVVNTADIVPRLPPAYVATGTEIELNSTTYPVVAHRVACYHTLTTYLWLLNQQSEYGLGTCERSPAAALPAAVTA
jgi:triacylglycerol lipase